MMPSSTGCEQSMVNFRTCFLPVLPFFTCQGRAQQASVRCNGIWAAEAALRTSREVEMPRMAPDSALQRWILKLLVLLSALAGPRLTGAAGMVVCPRERRLCERRVGGVTEK